VAGGFAGDVVDDAVDAADLVDDSVGYDAKNCRQTRFSDRDNGCNLKVVLIQYNSKAKKSFKKR